MSEEIVLVKFDHGYKLTIGGQQLSLTENQFNTLYRLLFEEHYKKEHARTL